jgi:hypothetical protein
MERMWDDRMRHFFADRYDHRRNVVDWDYSFDVKNLVPQMFSMEYKQWRVTGLAFETRLATNTVPNRTMGSYVPGNHVSELNCTVLILYKEKNEGQDHGARFLGGHLGDALYNLWSRG